MLQSLIDHCLVKTLGVQLLLRPCLKKTVCIRVNWLGSGKIPLSCSDRKFSCAGERLADAEWDDKVSNRVEVRRLVVDNN